MYQLNRHHNISVKYTTQTPLFDLDMQEQFYLGKSTTKAYWSIVIIYKCATHAPGDLFMTLSMFGV